MTNANSHTEFAAQFGDRYARWILDFLIEFAHAVALDYVAQPDFYRGSDVPEHIVELFSSYGCLRNYPNKEQREALNQPVYGLCDDYVPTKGVLVVTDQFHQLREPLFRSCIAYEERNITDATRGLRQNVIDAMTYFPTYLRSFQGQSFKSGYHQIQSLSDLAYAILRSHTVSGVFGVVQPPDIAPSWPLQGDNQSAAQLVARISTKLEVGSSVITQQQESLLRSVAEEGREALVAVLREDPLGDDHFGELVSKVYSWAKTIDNYTSVMASMAK